MHLTCGEPPLTTRSVRFYHSAYGRQRRRSPQKVQICDLFTVKKKAEFGLLAASDMGCPLPPPGANAASRSDCSRSLRPHRDHGGEPLRVPPTLSRFSCGRTTKKPPTCLAETSSFILRPPRRRLCYRLPPTMVPAAAITPRCVGCLSLNLDARVGARPWRKRAALRCGYTGLVAFALLPVCVAASTITDVQGIAGQVPAATPDSGRFL
jgi:hypothetical protein